MKLRRISPWALLPVFLLLQSCSDGGDAGNPDASPLETLATRFGVMMPNEQMPVPDFDLVNLQGKRVRLSDFRGKIVFLTFSTTW